MKILVTNDDGYLAPGVRRLIEWLAPFGDVTAVCPDGPRSAQSMALTVNVPLRLNPVDGWEGPGRFFRCSGTPVDCVKLAMHTVMEGECDLVISGINHGSNAAVNVVYSGTMGAAMEGCAFGLPAVGFSLTDHSMAADFGPCRPYVEKIVRAVIEKGLPEGVCLNVNVPAGCVPEGMKVVRAARGKWTDEYAAYTDPFGQPFYMLTGRFVNEEPDAEDTDEWCLRHRLVSVVPTLLDRTAPSFPSLPL